jgi:hypothetical protein
LCCLLVLASGLCVFTVAAAFLFPFFSSIFCCFISYSLLCSANGLVFFYLLLPPADFTFFPNHAAVYFSGFGARTARRTVLRFSPSKTLTTFFYPASFTSFLCYPHFSILFTLGRLVSFFFLLFNAFCCVC